MKFAYIYASKPEIIHPEDKSFPPGSGIVSLRCVNFPDFIEIALNAGVVDIAPDQSFWLDVKIFCDGLPVKSEKDEYDPFRHTAFYRGNGSIIATYSFIDRFLAEKSGVYTFKAKLFDGIIPDDGEGGENYLDASECSIVIDKEFL